jgi:hypothetical protein
LTKSFSASRISSGLMVMSAIGCPSIGEVLCCRSLVLSKS